MHFNHYLLFLWIFVHFSNFCMTYYPGRREVAWRQSLLAAWDSCCYLPPLAHGLDVPSPATSWSPALLICTRGVFPSYICWISKLFMFYKIIIKNVNCVYLINIGVNYSWQTEFSYCIPVIQFILSCISLLTSVFFFCTLSLLVALSLERFLCDNQPVWSTVLPENMVLVLTT